MNKVLYATGLISGGIETIGQSLTQGITVNAVQSLEEAFKELEENSSEYSFCIICAKSFYATGNRTEDGVFSDLQLFVTQNPHITFAFVDFDSQYNAKYKLMLAPLNNIRYTTISKASIRVFNSLLDKILEGSHSGKPAVQSKVTDEPRRTMPTKAAKPQQLPHAPVVPTVSNIPTVENPTIEEIYNTIDTTDESGFTNEPINEPTEVKQEIATPKPKKSALDIFRIGKKQNKESNLPEVRQQDTPTIQITQKKKQPIRGNLKDLQGKSLLFTQVSSCGATTVALMTAKQLTKLGLTVCYVEVSTTYASSNAIIDSDFFEVSGVNRQNNLDVFINGSATNNAECFEMCEDVHILRNNPSLISAETNIKSLSKRLSNMFDIVVYDVSMPILRLNPLFLLACSTKYLVVTNDYSDISKLAIELTRQTNDFYNQENVDLLCNAICKEFKIVISRYMTCDGKSKRKFEWRDVLEEIVNSNEELADIEMQEIVAVVPESISISNNLFAPDSTKHIGKILEGLK